MIARIYVAGKYTAPTYAERKANVSAAARVAADVCRLGAYPVLPHVVGWECEEMHGVKHPYEWWIEATKRDLLTCDAVMLVPGWEQSSGARGERELAISVGIPVFEDLLSLRGWLEERA